MEKSDEIKSDEKNPMEKSDEQIRGPGDYEKLPPGPQGFSKVTPGAPKPYWLPGVRRYIAILAKKPPHPFPGTREPVNP